MTISEDRIKPLPGPDSWTLNEIFETGVVIGTYLTLIIVLFYWTIISTTFFETHFHVRSNSSNVEEVTTAIYLQVSIVSQALIFVTHSQSWSLMEIPGTLLMCSFVVAQLKFWIERPTGKLCLFLSARNLNITWGDDNRYWHWISHDESSFKEIAELIAVCWLEVRGQFDCKLLSPGAAYSVSFRLKVHQSGIIRNFGRRAIIPPLPRAYGWNRKPVKFSLTPPCGDHQKYARYLSDLDKPVETEGYQMASFRHVEEGWMEFDARRFVVQEKGDNPGSIEFCMSEWEGGNWKGGLLLEGVTILPTSLVRERAE